MTNKVKINIFGTDYTVTTGESPEYVNGLAAEIDNSVRNFIEASSASLPEALVVVALAYLDSHKKSEKSSDNLRKQVAEYLEEASTAKLELTKARAEIERLSREQQMKIKET